MLFSVVFACFHRDIFAVAWGNDKKYSRGVGIAPYMPQHKQFLSNKAIISTLKHIKLINQNKLLIMPGFKNKHLINKALKSIFKY